MVEDSTIACMYYEGSGTNQITFRGTAQTNAAAGFLAFNGEGVGETGIITGINFDGSANLEEEDGKSAIGIRLESGTAAAGTAGDSLIADGSAAATLTVNGALTQSTTLVVDAVAGATLAVGQVITVNGAGSTPAASITDADGNTAISTNNTLTITAVASQTSVTVSEPITVANNIVLLASTNGGDEIISDSVNFTVAGPLFNSRSDIKTITRTGADDSVALELEVGTENLNGVAGGQGDVFRLVQESGNAASNNSDGRNEEGDDLNTDPYVVENSLSDIATFLESGTTSGSANILRGVDVAAS